MSDFRVQIFWVDLWVWNLWLIVYGGLLLCVLRFELAPDD